MSKTPAQKLRFAEICEQYHGIKLSKGGYEFTGDNLAKVITDLVGPFSIAPELVSRRGILTKCFPNISAKFKALPDEQIAGWAIEGKKWVRAWDYIDATDNDIIRCCVADDEKRTGLGFSGKLHDGLWVRKHPASIKTMLQASGKSKPEAEQLMGYAEIHPWTITSVPFKEEYPGERTWNLGAPQLKHKPNPGPFPHWQSLLNNVGREANDNGLWLAQWLAFKFRRPELRLPLIFLYSKDENTGKSSFHEAIRLLVTHGVVHADLAITSQFNGELAGAAFCVVEEIDVNTPVFHRKIKQLITGLDITIRRMFTPAYETKNYTAWIQCSNDLTATPKDFGDTRIQTFEVKRPENLIPKDKFFELLEKEAPAFVHHLLNLELPKVKDRLALPLIDTPSMRKIARANLDPVTAGIIDGLDNTWSGRADQFPFYSGITAKLLTKILTRDEQILKQHGITFELETKRNKIFTLTRAA